LKRREFISFVGGAAATPCFLWPLAVRAQQGGKLPILGYLGAGTQATESDRVAALRQRLQQLGWIEGRSIATEWRWAEGRRERAIEFAAELVRLKVDIIVTTGTPQVVALKQATSVVPIVGATMGDPVGDGLVTSLARPGGNITGLSLQQPDLAGKRLEMLREAVPGLRRLAIMGNFSNPPVAQELRQVQTAAGRLGVEAASHEIKQTQDIGPAFDALKGRGDALYVASDQLTLSNRTRIHILALGARLPTIYNSRDYVEGGGLLSYGPSFSDLFRRAAEYVDKILRGAKPADLPVEQPTRFDLAINLITAKAIGLELRATLLARADEVIE
jgi:ABC-type uncharacterized transport system substrate-binding protein